MAFLPAPASKSRSAREGGVPFIARSRATTGHHSSRVPKQIPRVVGGMSPSPEYLPGPPVDDRRVLEDPLHYTRYSEIKTRSRET